jgi:hypothetical protein
MKFIDRPGLVELSCHFATGLPLQHAISSRIQKQVFRWVCLRDHQGLDDVMALGHYVRFSLTLQCLFTMWATLSGRINHVNVQLHHASQKRNEPLNFPSQIISEDNVLANNKSLSNICTPLFTHTAS